MHQIGLVFRVCAGLFAALIVLSSIASGQDLSRAIIYDLPAVAPEEFRKQVPISTLSAADSAEIMSYRFPGDTVKVLAIYVDWPDRPAVWPVETIDSLLFSIGVYPGGSLADYYLEVSYGQTTIVGEVIEWEYDGLYSNFSWPDFNDVIYALDPIFDFSPYDGNGDGKVDAITFVRSGNGEEDSQDPNDIWSFAVGFGNPGLGPFDGVYIDRWNTSPETRPLRDSANPTLFTGSDTLNNIRVFAHELGHNLGLPDLYDYDSKLDMSTYVTPGDANDHPLVDWCIMGYYGYGYLAIGSEIASHFSGWCKKELGWLEPVTVASAETSLVLYDVETHGSESLYRVPIDTIKDEYFFLEYRNPSSTAMFDKLDSDFSVYLWPDLTFGCDTLDRGLLITHIDESVGYGNNGSPAHPNYHVMVEDAGYNPTQDVTTNPGGVPSDSAQWWYPYETRKGALWSDDVPGQDMFGPSTSPNSDGYDGPTGIVIQVDSIVNEKLYVTVHNPMFVVDTSCCHSSTGNVDCDENNQVDIVDLTELIDHLFISFGEYCCREEANIDGDENGNIDIVDLTELIDHLFISFKETAVCK